MHIQNKLTAYDGMQLAHYLHNLLYHNHNLKFPLFKSCQDNNVKVK